MDFLSEFVAKNSPKIIVSQLIGFVASGLLLFSFQQRTHKRIVAMQAFSGFLFAVQYYMLGAYEGMAGNIVGMTRAVAYYFRGRIHRDNAPVHKLCPEKKHLRYADEFSQ